MCGEKMFGNYGLIKKLKMKEIEDCSRAIIRVIGENPGREDLSETPRRTARGWKELLSGYTVNETSLYKTFECDNHNLIIVTHLTQELRNHREHKML